MYKISSLPFWLVLLEYELWRGKHETRAVWPAEHVAIIAVEFLETDRLGYPVRPVVLVLGLIRYVFASFKCLVNHLCCRN